NVLVLFAVLFLFLPKLGFMKIDDITHSYPKNSGGPRTVSSDSRLAQSDLSSPGKVFSIRIAKEGVSKCPNCQIPLKNNF
ncbi:MAG: hypothetical protein Q8P67_28160, partial [archaeon]|nr:hypothetical protein [archaeon]